MTLVKDRKIDMTPPSPASPRSYGYGTGRRVPLAGGTWVAAAGAAVAAEAQQTHAVFNEYDYRVVARPSRWRLERTATGFVASDRVTGIFGAGDNVNRAIVDLVTALHEHRDVLERQATLAPGLREQLDYLRALF